MVNDSQPYTLSFKVTGLDVASRYNYVLSTLDANGTPLHVYTGTFATIGYPGALEEGGDEIIPTPPIIPSNPEAPEGIDFIRIFEGSNGKILRNGQIYLIYEGRMYDVRGKRVE
jgi:hypothetical protein